MKKLRGTLLSLSVVAAFAAGHSTFANLVTNPGFETGGFTGWTQSGNTSFSGVDGNPHSGVYSAFFGPLGSNGFLTQNLATTAGGLYDLNFWLDNDGGTPNHFEVSWGGSIISSLNNAGAFGYTLFSFTGLAASTSSTQLQFGFRQDPSFWFLDDVSVESATATPEAFSTLWLALPFVGMIAFRRFRTARV
jgi:hypothetical protein